MPLTHELTSQRGSMMSSNSGAPGPPGTGRSSALTSTSTTPDEDFSEVGHCAEVCCSASMLTRRGRVQKTCQLVWVTLLSAVALIVYATAQFSIQIADFRSRQINLKPDVDHVRLTSECLTIMRSVQSLRLVATTYMASGGSRPDQNSRPEVVNFVSGYVRNSFEGTLSQIAASRVIFQAANSACSYQEKMKQMMSAPPSPFRVIWNEVIGNAPNATAGSYCTVYDYVSAVVSEILSTVMNATSTAQPVQTLTSFTDLVNLIGQDCSSLMDYSGQRGDVALAIRHWTNLVELEESYSTIQALGTIYLFQPSSGGTSVDARMRVALLEYWTLTTHMQFQLKTGIYGASDAVDLSGLPNDLAELLRNMLTHLAIWSGSTSEGRSIQPEMAIALERWISGLRTLIQAAEQSTDEALASVGSQVTAERQAVGPHVGFAVFVWIVVFVILLPLVSISAERNMATVQAYTTSFESKELELKREKRKTEALLNEMLPRSIRLKLQQGEASRLSAEQYESATIFFSDVTDFAEMSSTRSPIELVIILNEIYSFMDNRIQKFDVYKVETISCVYMVVSGVPVRNGSRHTAEVALMSLDIINAAKQFHIKDMPELTLNLRIGVHTGPVVAGVVGNKMPRYCLFGDTVNTASRMQSNGLPHRIQISATTYRSLNGIGGFVMESRGTIKVKGKGEMYTYWLLSQDARTSSSEAEML